ncbi:hypothetical protein [Robertkochia flava]|uniref:hypothetical protein n=1 Tax=Robertkochia flava TaxID=3447986 RepID=UPI001CCEFB3C|nr:hypothetical protein [Robertkochia marina]
MSRIKAIKPAAIILIVFLAAIFFYGRYKIIQVEKDLTDLKLPGFSLTTITANISILKNSTILKGPDLHYRFSNDSLSVKASQIALYGIHYTSLLLEGKLKADSLVILDPDIHLLPSKDTVPISSLTESKKQPSIELGTLRLKEGQAIKISKNSDTLFIADPIHMELKKLVIDPESKEEYNTEEYAIQLENLLVQPDPLNNLHLKKIQLNTNQWKITAMDLVPKYSKRNYTKYLQYQNDRIVVSIDSIVINNPGHQHLKDRLFKAASIDIYKADMDVFRDKFIPRKDEYKKMLSAIIRDAPLATSIDSIRIHDSSVRYGELVNSNGVIGEILISEINLEMNPLRSRTRDTTNMVFTAKIMEEGIVQGMGAFPVYAADNRFRLSIHLSNLHYHRLNAFTSPNMNVVNRGLIKDAFITLNGNENNAKGNVLMAYKDYKVSIMDKKGVKEKKLLSAVANVIIKKENDSGKQETFEVERNKERSFFNYLWLGIQKALLTAMT